jgi:hypothetical protein
MIKVREMLHSGWKWMIDNEGEKRGRLGLYTG